MNTTKQKTTPREKKKNWLPKVWRRSRDHLVRWRYQQWKSPRRPREDTRASRHHRHQPITRHTTVTKNPVQGRDLGQGLEVRSAGVDRVEAVVEGACLGRLLEDPQLHHMFMVLCEFTVFYGIYIESNQLLLFGDFWLWFWYHLRFLQFSLFILKHSLS